MRWQGNRESDNVEDLRNDSGGNGSGRGFTLGGGQLGVGSVVVALLASYFLGVNPLTMLNLLSNGSGLPVPAQSSPTRPTQPPAQDSETRFVRTVLADTEDVWHHIFQQAGEAYQNPKLVLFRNAVPTACGTGKTATGPFYCPADHKVYIDLAFYDVLKERLGAPGDFAQAYVIAHEVGHHVQNLLGTSDKIEAMRSKVSQAHYNSLSVRLELQADCYAGVWAHHANPERQLLEAGDIEEAMNAAAQIGDDTLQRNAGQTVSPESFTHGTSAQRQTWFKRGLDSGDLNQCKTFAKGAI